METETSSPAGHHRRELRPDAAERISAGCYGALIAATTLIEIGDEAIWHVVLFVVVTNLIYYITHVFAYTIGDHHADEPLPKTVLHHLKVSAPIVSATFGPLVVVLLLRLFGVAETTAALFGVLAAVAFLATVATTGAYLRRFSTVVVVITPVVTIIVALALVWAKHSLH